MRRKFIHLTLLLLTGCATQTYWSFPEGKTLYDFRIDEQSCNNSIGVIENCLSAKGYTKITLEQFQEIQKKELAPVTIVARNIVTGHIYAGKATTTIGALSSSIEITGLTNGQVCTGYSEITKVVGTGSGSLGNAELLCRDGRRIIADFVYQTTRTGHGRGADTFDNVYQFMFGDFEVDTESLKAKFDKFFEKQKPVPKKYKRIQS